MQQPNVLVAYLDLRSAQVAGTGPQAPALAASATSDRGES
jgi:hypothetical protein